MGVPHKHAEIIKAWADGADIEKQDRDGTWVDMHRSWPWYEDWVYRIKPQPKPDIVRWCWATEHIGEGDAARWISGPNLKLTLDGETGKLKKAEVL